MMGAYPAAAPGWEEDEVKIASVSRIFFKGEVVKLNLDSTLPDATNTNSLQPIATSASEWDDADLAVQVDIDFNCGDGNKTAENSHLASLIRS